MIRLDVFWATVIWALVSALLQKVGFTVIADKLLSAFSLIFQRAEYQEFLASWRELRDARKGLTTISAQDEFAKWARQQRCVDQLQAKFDRLNGKRQRGTMAKQMGLAVLLRIIMYGMTAWWLGWRTSGVPTITMSQDLLGPLGGIMSLPRCKTGNRNEYSRVYHLEGGVSSAALFAVSQVALEHLLG